MYDKDMFQTVPFRLNLNHDEDALGKKESSKNVLAMLGDLQHKVRLSNIMTCVCHRLMFLCFSFLLS